jgi:hypothetical protein
MLVSKGKLPYLLLAVSAGCLFLNADLFIGGPHHDTNRQMQSSESYGEILADGTLFIPVGDTAARSEGQNLQEKVKKTRQLMCNDLLADREEKKLTRLHVQTELCGDFSLGNIISTLLSYNLAAHLADIPFTFSCVDSKPGVMATMQKHEEKSGLPPDFDKETYNLEKYCESGRFHDMAYGQYLVADTIRNQIAPSQKVVTEGDDAVIHVRLNDAFKRIGRPSQRGLFPHVAYTKMLKLAEEEKGEIRSISIVTESFNKAKVRELDVEFTDLSRIVAHDLERQLKEDFPNAEVHIHNNWRIESTVTSYARLARAKKIAICGCSTFCPFPVMSVEDDVLGYLYDSEYLNAFYPQYLAENKENMHLWDAPLLGSNQIDKLSTDEILEFVRNKDTSGITLM